MMLIDFAAKATVLLACGALGVRGLRHASAASRHAVWTTVFVALLLLPVARGVMPGWSIIQLPERWSLWTHQPPTATSSAHVRFDLEAAVDNQAGSWAWWQGLNTSAALVTVWLAGAGLQFLWMGM